MSLQGWIHQAEARLRGGQHAERAHADAELLLLHLLQKDRVFLIAHPKEVLTAAGAVRYHALIDRRLRGEPMQYIVGEVEFYGLPFHVTRDVLIPRNETEGLVEKVLECAQQFQAGGTALRIADVGTGSGAIAVALAWKLCAAGVDAEITAIDISQAALAVAIGNAERNGVGDRIRFLHGDLLTPVAEERFHIVVSNPPYVPRGDRESLAVEVRDYEPGLALFAGDDGLEMYRRLIPEAFGVLEPGGLLGLEIGFGQGGALVALMEGAGFEGVESHPDLQGIPRVVCGRRV